MRMTSNIQILDDRAIRTVSMHRPERKNALTQAMYTAMTEALVSAQSDPNIRVVVVQGSGGVFTAGNDLDDFAGGAGDWREIEEQPVVRFLRALVRTEKPLIAAVEGMAVGVGVTLLLHCDFAYSTRDAMFVTPFVDLGLVPEAASSLLMPQIVGLRRAYEMLLLGDRLCGADAAACGLINRAVDDPVGEAGNVAARLAEKAPAALRRSRALLRLGSERFDERMSTEMAEFRVGLKGTEFAEAVKAFKEKRKPQF